MSSHPLPPKGTPAAPRRKAKGAPSPSYRFEPLDRLRFYGPEYVYLRATEGGHVLRMRNGSLEKTFGDTDTNRLAHSRGFGHDRRFYAEGNAKARERSGGVAMSDIPPAERMTTNWKHNLCLRFLSMEARGEASRSDAKMKVAIKAIFSDMANNGAILPMIEKSRGGEALQRITLRGAPTPRALRTWLRELETSGMRGMALRDSWRNSGNRQMRLHPEAHALINDAAQAFATEKRPTIRKCHDDLLGSLRTKNAERAKHGLDPIPDPSIKAVTKAIRKLPAFEVRAGRFGLDAARRYFRLVKSSPEATRPGERVEIDEWTTNIQKVMTKQETWANLPSEARSALTGRWLVCAAIDVATKCILGVRMGPTATGSLAKSTLKNGGER